MACSLVEAGLIVEQEASTVRNPAIKPGRCEMTRLASAARMAAGRKLTPSGSAPGFLPTWGLVKGIAGGVRTLTNCDGGTFGRLSSVTRSSLRGRNGRSNWDDADAKPSRSTLDLYREIVMDTATFIAAFMDWDPQRKQYVLGPGIASADERHRDLAHNINPTMELGYWRWALEAAQTWRERLGVGRDKQWDHVLSLWSPLPMRNGTYPILEAPVDGLVSNMATWLDGILPPKGVDTAVMRETLHQTAKAPIQRSQRFVMWGNAMVAMCAARLNEPDLALDLLIGKYERNPFMVSGYARGYADIPVYLPANGGWLAATAMMAAGWDGAPSTHAPGFPADWKVRWEGLSRMT